MSLGASPEDVRFVERLKSRDERAFNTLVRTYERRVFGLVFHMLGNQAEAEDLSQEVFITVFRSIDSFRGEARLGTWLYRVAINHCKNRIKYLDRRVTRGHDELDGEGSKALTEGGPVMSRPDRPDEAMQGAEMSRVIERALGLLEEEHRALVVLRDLEGLSYEEIMAITGLPEGTVKSRLHRARAALREAIERGLGYKLPE